MRNINKISVWKSPKGEVRVYVSFEGEKEQGVIYRTGNAYQPKNHLENITIEERKAALEISSKIHGENKWGTCYENQINPTTTKNTNYSNSFTNSISEMNRDIKKGFRVNPDDYLNP